MDIATKLKKIQTEIPEQVTLIAVSKTKPIEDIQTAYDAGQRVFGENKAQEMNQKHADLPKDINWHFIGHLQTNKVKYIAPFVSLIHSIDSSKLLDEINKQAAKNARQINCLLQFHIADETTKFGLNMEEATNIINRYQANEWPHIILLGVMGMATYTDDIEQISKEFSNLKSNYDHLKMQFFPTDSKFKEISMGMSGDYCHAIKAGSTMVRIGSSIFGARNYAR